MYVCIHYCKFNLQPNWDIMIRQNLHLSFAMPCWGKHVFCSLQALLDQKLAMHFLCNAGQTASMVLLLTIASTSLALRAAAIEMSPNVIQPTPIAICLQVHKMWNGKLVDPIATKKISIIKWSRNVCEWCMTKAQSNAWQAFGYRTYLCMASIWCRKLCMRAALP